VIEIPMSRNAAQPGVKPDGRCHGSATAALRASRTMFDIFLAKEVVPEADRVELRGSDPFRPVWSRLSKMPDVESVDSIATCFFRTE
jgi:hypothetical protein